MKKSTSFLCAAAMAICLVAGDQLYDMPRRYVAYASAQPQTVGPLDNNTSSKGTDKFKAEFAFSMAQITTKVLSMPNTNVETFKVQIAYATAQVTAKVLPMLPADQQDEFAYSMAKITTKIISDPNLDVEKAKVEFSYEMAQLTAKIISRADASNTGSQPAGEYKTAGVQNTSLLRNNADIQPKAKEKPVAETKPVQKTADVSPETYKSLVNELGHVGDRSKQADNKVNVDGEIRYHYANNRGLDPRISSGIRARLGFDTNFNKDWRINGQLEAEKSLVNYNDKFDLSRLNAVGKVGASTMTIGSFGYLMAEGNIYDSGFKGLRYDIGYPVKYTFSFGKTDVTEETNIASAKYADYDYNLEAGLYQYQKRDGTQDRNTIWSLGGNYLSSDFSVGAMYLGSTLKDSKGNSQGYVFSFNYGDLKTYRPNTYSIFAKYYNQPVGTYIQHGMNGLGGSMQGFRGYGLGFRYTLAKDLVGGLEYYNLTDKVLGEKGQTWWSELNFYF